MKTTTPTAMTETSNTITRPWTACAPEHRTGSKPHIVPVLGNREREVHQFVVYHGLDYLDADGVVVLHPTWMTWNVAQAAIATHASAVSA